MMHYYKVYYGDAEGNAVLFKYASKRKLYADSVMNVVRRRYEVLGLPCPEEFDAVKRDGQWIWER